MRLQKKFVGVTLAFLLVLGDAVVGTTLLFGRQVGASTKEAVRLQQQFDADNDGFYNELEIRLGSNPNDKNSTPESHALPDLDGNGVADVCEDGIDNDKDSLIDDDDPDCKMAPLTVDLEPGLDVFGSSAKIEAGAFGPGIPPEALQLQGPVAVKRGQPDGGTLPVEIVAMQLNGISSQLGPVTLIENPALPSQGKVTSKSGAPPWSSFFEINTLILVRNQVIAEPKLRVEIPSIDHLPPVQDSRKVDPSKCYQFPGGLHCPEVPRFGLPVLKWVAKFDCGVQPSTPPPFLGPVKPGNYATKIVVHNPHGVPVNLEKKVSEGARNPKAGPVSRFESVKLLPDSTTEIDCEDIFRLLGQQIPEKGKELPFKNGVVVILSAKKLDVIANYTQEVVKEEIDFIIKPPTNAPPPMRALANKRLKMVTLVSQEKVIVEEAVVRELLKQQFPAEIVELTKITIVDDDLGVGSSMEVVEIRPQKCILMDPPDLPKGQLNCKVQDP